METTKFIVITYFAAFAGVVPPGLVNMSVAKTCVEKDKRNGVFVAIGASIVNFLHAFIAILMAKYIFNHPSVRGVLLKIGLVVFAGLFVYFIFAARKNKSKKNQLTKKDSRKSFAKGFFIANLNIFPIPYFVFISTELSTNASLSFSWLYIFLFALSASLGTFTVLYIYVESFMKINKHTKSFSKYANYFMAVLMLALFIITLFRIYNGN